MLPYYHIGLDTSPSSSWVQQAVKADAKKPAPTLGQLGVCVTKWTVLINAHCSARTRQ